MENELRFHRCCFTGHRPGKLIRSEKEIVALLEREIRASVGRGFVTYLTGMAQGVDIWAAEIVLQLKQEGCPLHLICACPYPGFENSWSDDWKKKYRDIIASADLVRYISSSYNAACFQKRNEWMVDHSALVIAVYENISGGTRNTIEYALRKGIEIKRI